MIKEHKYRPPLTKAIKRDVLMVGGRFIGVSAAWEFLRNGLSVVLTEKDIVGGTFGVNPLVGLQAIKDLLIDNGVQVFEGTGME